MSQAEHLAKTYQNTQAQHLNVQSEENLSSLIRGHELVVRSVGVGRGREGGREREGERGIGGRGEWATSLGKPADVKPSTHGK